MHYQIDGFIIESELAAKSTKQRNKIVMRHIDQIPEYSNVLDYGCGKLRYSIPLAKRVNHVCAIDSKYQLEKKQKIEDQLIKPIDYKLPNLSIHEIGSMNWKEDRYDVVFCVNVLSAIPNDYERLKMLTNAKQVLGKNGYVYIVTQYRNSYFNEYSQRDDANAFHDGWLIKKQSNKGTFYGLIPPEKIIQLCKEVGLNNHKVMKNDGSCYIQAYI